METDLLIGHRSPINWPRVHGAIGGGIIFGLFSGLAILCLVVYLKDRPWDDISCRMVDCQIADRVGSDRVILSMTFETVDHKADRTQLTKTVPFSTIDNWCYNNNLFTCQRRDNELKLINPMEVFINLMARIYLIGYLAASGSIIGGILWILFK